MVLKHVFAAAAVPEKQSGFTLVELLVVIVILTVLASAAIPRFINLQRAARIATLKGIEGSMRSTITMIQSKARVQGLSPMAANPGNNAQTIFLVSSDAGTFEVDWRNLCPESRGELGDAIDMPEHIDLTEAGGLQTIITNRYTRVGYDIRGSGPPTTNGCYVTYDSFGDPICTVTLVDTDC